MPSRIIREGIITSELVNKLTDRAELFYRRLMSVADDYGRYYANPSLLRAACYPLKLDKVSEKDIKQHLSECTEAGIIKLYCDTKYLQIMNFGQQTRSKSKFPEPSENELLINCEADAKQMLSLVGVGVEVDNRISGFKKPSSNDVTQYSKEIEYPLDGQAWIDAYEQKGWMVGKNKMKDWKAAVRTWKHNGWVTGAHKNGSPKSEPARDLSNYQPK